MVKLTNDTVRTLPAGTSGDAIYPDTDSRNGVPGLCLRVRAGGSRTFIIQWRQGQLQRRSTIGCPVEGPQARVAVGDPHEDGVAAHDSRPFMTSLSHRLTGDDALSREYGRESLTDGHRLRQTTNGRCWNLPLHPGYAREGALPQGPLRGAQ